MLSGLSAGRGFDLLPAARGQADGGEAPPDPARLVHLGLEPPEELVAAAGVVGEGRGVKLEPHQGVAGWASTSIAITAQVWFPRLCVISSSSRSVGS